MAVLGGRGLGGGGVKSGKNVAIAVVASLGTLFVAGGVTVASAVPRYNDGREAGYNVTIDRALKNLDFIDKANRNYKDEKYNTLTDDPAYKYGYDKACDEVESAFLSGKEQGVKDAIAAITPKATEVNAEGEESKQEESVEQVESLEKRSDYYKQAYALGKEFGQKNYEAGYKAGFDFAYGVTATEEVSEEQDTETEESEVKVYQTSQVYLDGYNAGLEAARAQIDSEKAEVKVPTVQELSQNEAIKKFFSCQNSVAVENIQAVRYIPSEDGDEKGVLYVYALGTTKGTAGETCLVELAVPISQENNMQNDFIQSAGNYEPTVYYQLEEGSTYSFGSTTFMDSEGNFQARSSVSGGKVWVAAFSQGATVSGGKVERAYEFQGLILGDQGEIEGDLNIDGTHNSSKGAREAVVEYFNGIYKDVELDQ